MNSRERVRKAIRFEEPDRVPIDVGGSLVTGICIDAYVALVKYLGLDLGLPIVYEQFGMMARLAEPVRQRLHSDVIELENPSVAWDLENKDFKPWKTGPGNMVLMPGGFNPVTDETGIPLYLGQTGQTDGIHAAGRLVFRARLHDRHEQFRCENESGGLGRLDPALQRRASPAVGGIG